MSRKPRIPIDGAPPLVTNPFAALVSSLGELTPKEPVAPAPAPAPEHTPIDASSAIHERLVLRREKKGRGGKTVTVIEGLRAPEPALQEPVLQELAQQLRRHLGCGAHVEGATVVVSGAQTERVREWLAAQGATRIVVGN